MTPEVYEAHSFAQLQLHGAKATINMALADSWKGDYKATLKEVMTQKDDAVAAEKKLRKYLDLAAES